jgi:hypothetical protein
MEVSFKEGRSLQGGKTNRWEEKGKSSSSDRKKNIASIASYSTSRLLLLRDTKEKLPFALASVYPALTQRPALLIFLSHDCLLPVILERKCVNKYFNVTLIHNSWNNILFTYCINCT